MTVSPLRCPGSAPARRAPDPVKLAKAQAAAERARRFQGEQVGGRVLPVSAGLRDLLPDRGLRVGTTYDVQGSMALLAALLAEPSSTGLWCGVVGMPEFAAVAAHELGCDLDRLVFVPDPGPEWVNVTAALVDALSVVVVRPVGRVSDGEVSRLAARLRQREAVLISAARWPRADISLLTQPGGWSGVGAGDGHLRHRRASVQVRGRGLPLPSRVDVWLPGEHGSAQVAAGPSRVDELDSGLPAAVGWP